MDQNREAKCIAEWLSGCLRTSHFTILVIAIFVSIAPLAKGQLLLAHVPRDGQRSHPKDASLQQYKDGHWEQGKKGGYFIETPNVWSQFLYDPNDFTYSKLDLRDRIDLAMDWMMFSEAPSWLLNDGKNPSELRQQQQRLYFGQRFFNGLSMLDQSVIAEGALNYLLIMLSNTLEYKITIKQALDAAERFLAIALRNPNNDLDVNICQSADSLAENIQDGQFYRRYSLLLEFYRKFLDRASANPTLANTAGFQCETFRSSYHKVKVSLKEFAQDSLDPEIADPPEDDKTTDQAQDKNERYNTPKIEQVPQESSIDRTLRCPIEIVEKNIQAAILQFQEFPDQYFEQHVKLTERRSRDPQSPICLIEFVISRKVANPKTASPVYSLQRKGELNRSIGKVINFSTAKQGAIQFYSTP